MTFIPDGENAVGKTENDIEDAHVIKLGQEVQEPAKNELFEANDATIYEQEVALKDEFHGIEDSASQSNEVATGRRSLRISQWVELQRSLESATDGSTITMQCTRYVAPTRDATIRITAAGVTLRCPCQPSAGVGLCVLDMEDRGQRILDITGPNFVASEVDFRNANPQDNGNGGAVRDTAPYGTAQFVRCYFRNNSAKVRCCLAF